jgi:hypothetical protein
VSNHPLAGRFFPAAPLTRDGYVFEFIKGADPRVRISDRAQTVEEPLQWAFGAGEQAVTFVSRINDEFHLEHYWSYYPAIGKMAPTPGQDALRPKSLAEAPGLLYKSTDPESGILGCFECHSTGPVAAKPQIAPSQPGVWCEACHGPGATHAKTASKGDIRNPARLNAGELNTMCGKCHRPPASDPARIDWNYAWNVRHPPVYLSESACFQKSNGRLTCLTCHAAHEPLVHRPVAYNTKCSGCHAQPPKVCTTNCIDCHMPRVVPQAPLRFTNHWIGVYGEGAKLRPRLRPFRAATKGSGFYLSPR